jgi:hypothetical protein
MKIASKANGTQVGETWGLRHSFVCWTAGSGSQYASEGPVTGRLESYFFFLVFLCL